MTLNIRGILRGGRVDTYLRELSDEALREVRDNTWSTIHSVRRFLNAVEAEMRRRDWAPNNDDAS